MAIRSVPQVVLDEANDVLRDLADWSRQAPYCPNCLSLPGCSHDAGCPLGRVARLRYLLGSNDQQRRDDALVALRRERRERVTSEADRPLLSGSAPTSPIPAIDLLLPTSVHIDACAQDQSEARGIAPDAVDDAQARAFVVETLNLAATRCFAEASAIRGHADRATAGPLRAAAGALCERAGRYAEAAAGWLSRNGSDALLGQRALLRAFGRHAESEGAKR